MRFDMIILKYQSIPKYQDKANLCYMGTGSFIVYTKTDDVFKDIANDVEKRFELSS